MFESVELKRINSMKQDLKLFENIETDTKNQFTSRFCSSAKKEPKVKI